MKDSLLSLVKGMYAAWPRSALVRLLGFVPVLAVTMAAGPCGKEPLGSVDGGSSCSYQGAIYHAGNSFPAADGCNTCTCGKDGLVSCTEKGCRDGGGSDGVDGSADLRGRCFDNNGYEISCPDGGIVGMCFDITGKAIPCSDGGTTDVAPICFDVNGNVIPCNRDGGVDVCTYAGKTYPAGASFPASDNCNRCTCGADGLVSCTEMGCVDAGADAATTCNYQGKVYAVGDHFPASDGCNTCTCWQGGIVPCTVIACQDAGATKDAGVITGVCKPGQDSMCNEDPFASALRGKCQPDGSCLCNGAGTSGVVSPYTGKCLAPDNLTGDGCEMYKTYPVGSTFPCGDSSCTTCKCAGPGKVAVLDSTCSDAGTPVCGLDAVYIYGDVGGLRVSQDQITIAPSPTSPGTSATYTRTRNYVDGSPGVSCAPAFPSCGDAAAIDVADIMADLHDPAVQKALTSDPAKPQFYGFDTRPVDGTAFSFMRGDGHGFLVGQACGTSSSASSCVTIPTGIDKLVKDLRALDEQQLRSASCAALR